MLFCLFGYLFFWGHGKVLGFLLKYLVCFGGFMPPTLTHKSNELSLARASCLSSVRSAAEHLKIEKKKITMF